MKLLDSLSLPHDLRTLSSEELEQVAQELRDELIELVSRSGGHFASSLGATEISVASHASFNTPNDRLVWDVGHQGYIHKMLTGRRSLMSSIRKKDGISGFLRRDESEFDSFGAGHAGTSISAAVGMSLGFSAQGEDRYVVPIIGDGSLTAGMAFEALNHAGSIGLKNFIVVLNDNEMSISPNVGALSWLFSRTVTSETGTMARRQVKDWHQRGYVPDFVYRAIDCAEEAAQGYFSTASTVFESFGFRYIGPVDGHSIPDLMKALENAKRQDVPVLVHAHTVKGKGFEAAEADPLTWHGVKPFDPEKGVFRKSTSKPGSKNAPSYTAVFSDTLVELAALDPKIVGITAAMPTGTGLDKLESALPSQFFDVGICEQHAVTCAAGLACEGMKPVCAIYSTFLQRAYDQVIHDVSIQELPVIFAIDRAGAVGNDGETHQGMFDISYLRTIPGMKILAPADENELRQMLYSALQYSGPTAIRYPRGSAIGVPIEKEFSFIEPGRAEVKCTGSDVLLICLGPVTYAALEAARRLKTAGISATVVNSRSAKPLDAELLCREAARHEFVCTVEDHAVTGGFGSAVLECLNDGGIHLQHELVRFGARDLFTPHASQQEQYEMHGYDQESIEQAVLKLFGYRFKKPVSLAG